MTHYYDTDGKPQHKVLNKAQTQKQGKDIYRDSTKADAKKHGWFPGATAPVNQFEKPQLEAWKKMTMWDVIKEFPRGNVEPFQHWKTRIEKALKQELEQYQKLGSKVHADIEFMLTHANVRSMAHDDSVIGSCCCSFREWYLKSVGEVIASEQTFCSPEWGYGGTLDLQYITREERDHDQGQFAIVDYKTRRTTEGVKIEQYLEQKRQLVAYALGIGKIMCSTGGDNGGYVIYSGPQQQIDGLGHSDLPILGNLFLSTTEPGRWEYIQVPPEEIPDLILDVRDCVRLWCRNNNFYHKEAA